MKYEILFDLMESSDNILVFQSTNIDRNNRPMLKRDKHYWFISAIPKYQYYQKCSRCSYESRTSGTLLNFGNLHIVFERELANFSHRYDSPDVLKRTKNLHKFQKECEMLEHDQEMLDMLRSYGKL